VDSNGQRINYLPTAMVTTFDWVPPIAMESGARSPRRCICGYLHVYLEDPDETSGEAGELHGAINIADFDGGRLHCFRRR
jgi:hypothetical protein